MEVDEGAVNGGSGVLPKSRARGAGEGDGAPPAAFPNPGREQRLILQFTMPLALRLVNDTPRYVDWRGTTGLECVPAKSAGCQKFLSSCCCFLPCLEPVRWDDGGSRKTVDANSQH